MTTGEERFWIADPSEHDTWADPRAATEWRIVDEEAGGTIAYADTYEHAQIRARLEELRTELRAERISYGELHELQGLVEHIEPGDVELLEAAGVPEFPDEEEGTE